jgi:hypothetical protein
MRTVSTPRAVFAAACITHAAYAGNLIKNGGFERPVIPPGKYVSYFLGKQFGPKNGKWTVVGPNGSNVSVTSTSYVCCGFKFPAERGLAFLDLTGAPDTGLPQGVSQTITTTPGATYRVSFGIGNIYDPHGNFGTTSTVNVYANGTLVISATNAKRHGGDTMVWQRFGTTFVAGTAQTTLSFINGDFGGSGDEICGLDDIFVAPVLGAK